MIHAAGGIAACLNVCDERAARDADVRAAAPIALCIRTVATDHRVVTRFSRAAIEANGRTAPLRT